jgi:hypothetical protein
MGSIFWDCIFPVGSMVAIGWYAANNIETLRAWWQSAQAFLGV